MKTLTYIAIFFALLFAFNSCKKGGLATPHLEATHATIKIGQTDTLELVGVAASDSVKWTVTPAGFNWIVSSHAHATVNFNKAGNYTITTTVNGAAMYTYLITVTNEVYNPTPPPVNGQATHISIAGDQITLLAHYAKSTKSDSAYVYFNAQTTNTYLCSNSYLNYTHSLDASNHFSIGFIDMYQPASKDCTTGNTTITSPVIPFVQSVQNTYLANGTFVLKVSLNGVTYTGSLAITATDVTFNWPYTSGVTITPQHFNR
jgi:aspartate 1-decarboxylase